MKNWSEQELKSAIDAYIAMREMQSAGKKFSKSDFYRTLSDRFGRTPKAYEYRMQNISHILSTQGREWIKGLKPAKNVGVNVASAIEQLLEEAENQTPTWEPASFHVDVLRLRKKGLPTQPQGNPTPAKQAKTIVQHTRDAAVVAWVLERAKGKCECCEKPAPFAREDGIPYLEVHHIQRLADGGPDTPANAIAVCPNCHRELHFGRFRESLKAKVTKKIPTIEAE